MSASCSSASISSSSSFIAEPVHPKVAQSLSSLPVYLASPNSYSSSSLSSLGRSFSDEDHFSSQSQVASSASKVSAVAKAELAEDHNFVEKLLAKIALTKSEKDQKTSQSAVEPFMIILQNESLKATPREQLTAALSVAPHGTIYESLIKHALVDYYYAAKQPHEAALLLGVSSKEPKPYIVEDSTYERLQLMCKQETSAFFLAQHADSRSLDDPQWKQWIECIDGIYSEAEKLKKENVEKYIDIAKKVGKLQFKVYQNFKDLALIKKPSLIEYLRRAAELDDEVAQYEYALTFIEDSDEAIKWLERCARNGEKKALSKLVELGKRLQKIGSPKAVTIFRIAAELEDGEAQYRLAEIYGCGGCGLDGDSESSIHWYKRAAENQYPQAVSYWERNRADFECLIQADRQNSLEAQLKMALLVCPKSGKKTIFGQNEARSQRYKKMAAVNHNHDESIKQVYEDLQSPDVNWVTAISLYEKAAAKGSAFAMWRLGGMLWRGSPPNAKFKLQEDQVKAIEWIRKAAAAGNKDAIDNLKENESIYAQLDCNAVQPKSKSGSLSQLSSFEIQSSGKKDQHK